MAKTKIKTHRGAAKRFNVTKNGKVKMNKAFRRHILNKKTTKRKRHLRKQAYCSNFICSSDSNLSLLCINRTNTSCVTSSAKV